MTENFFKKTVFFDLGNVIVHFCHKRMCWQIAGKCGLLPEQIEESFLYSPLGDLYERGGITCDNLHNHFCKHFSISIPKEEFFFAMSDIFTLNTAIVPIIEKLKANGVELILLSNTCPAHFDHIRKNYPILSLFDSAILSYEVGARKPEKKIFEHALAKSSSEIKNCFYTDDIQEYVESARSLGIDAHTFINTSLLTEALQSRGFL